MLQTGVRVLAAHKPLWLQRWRRSGWKGKGVAEQGCIIVNISERQLTLDVDNNKESLRQSFANHGTRGKIKCPRNATRISCSVCTRQCRCYSALVSAIWIYSLRIHSHPHSKPSTKLSEPWQLQQLQQLQRMCLFTEEECIKQVCTSIDDNLNVQALRSPLALS